jgi:Protein of unknown function (DUF3037)
VSGPGPVTGPASGAGAGEPKVFEYAVLRVVPRVDRGEAINAGVLVYCRPLRHLSARVELDADRLLALDPDADVEGIRQALAAIAAVCAEPPAAGQAAQAEQAEQAEHAGQAAQAEQAEHAGQAGQAGQAGRQDIGRRFRWLTAPRSTVVQPGPVHTGLTRDPAAEADRLLDRLVRRPGGPASR